MDKFEQTHIKVAGMDCTNCALTITKHLQKKGLQQVKVNFINGDVSFNSQAILTPQQIEKEIQNIGYSIVTNDATVSKKSVGFTNHAQRFLFCVLFALPLFLSHIFHIHFLMNGWVQLIITTPVFILGMTFFGKSAWRSVVSGVPNMNVLITSGSIIAFGYSLYGLLFKQSLEFLFFETVTTTLTLVFLGNYLEEKSIATTQTALKSLVITKKLMANMIAFDDEYKEQIFEVESKDLRLGDLILIKTGEQVPTDCKIIWGEADVDESIITGESKPILKKVKDVIIGGSIIQNGALKAQVTAVGNDSTLNQIVQMAENAQSEKPPIQQLADKISAIFIPAVLVIALLTVTANYFIFNQSFQESLLRSIAVLVIACPCAMGLATPAAIAVGLGRAAKSGIVFRNAKSLELFKQITQIVFDKTGTLTTGNFKIKIFDTNIDDAEFKKIVFSLEKYSTHPIAKSIAEVWKQKDDIKFKKIEEIKGDGMYASDKEGTVYSATSYKKVMNLTNEHNHQIYVTKNNILIGWIDVEDEIRPEAKNVIKTLKTLGIKTILLSGDKKDNCAIVAKTLDLDECIYEKTPIEKLQIITQLNNNQPTAMVGDGINDAPALAKATIGISLGNASQLAIQSAQVVLLKGGLTRLPTSLGLGKHTYLTIKQNLFWALAYNVVAIPIAACGLLGKYGPTFGALIMGLSDVVLVINSLRLRFKNVIS